MPVNFDTEPPSPMRQKYDWDTIVSDLKANPGKWGVVEAFRDVAGTDEAAQGAARALRVGKVGGGREGDFETTTRGATIYARYIGPVDDDDSGRRQ